MGGIIWNEIVEAVSGRGVDCTTAGEMLPAADRGIDIEWVELHPTADAADALGRQQRRAAAEKGIEDDVAADRAVENRIGDQRDWLYRRMQSGEVSFLTPSPELVRARVLPDIGPVAAMLAQFDVVAVPRPAVFEDVNQLVLAPVQRSHAGIVFDPDAQIFEFGINPQCRGQQLMLVAPIHADVMERSRGAVPDRELKRGGKKSGKLSRGHLSGRHQKLAMAYPAFP